MDCQINRTSKFIIYFRVIFVTFVLFRRAVMFTFINRVLGPYYMSYGLSFFTFLIYSPSAKPAGEKSEIEKNGDP